MARQLLRDSGAASYCDELLLRHPLERFAEQLQACDTVGHERLLEGPQAEGARRRGTRRPEEGGGWVLGHLAREHLALRQAEGFRIRDRPQALPGPQGEDPGQPRRQEGALAPARRERHRHFGGAPRDVREGAGGFGLGGDDEPRGEEARVDLQKRSMASSERDERRRSAFARYVKSIVSERFVFVDEWSTNISLRPIYARAQRGERARGKAPRNWGKNVSLVCAIDSGGVQPSMSVEGAVDGETFEAYVEHFLAPKLSRGQIVVMDNLSVHKSKRARRLIEEAGATLLFLPPYSPDMNPIEEAFSKLKAA